MNPCDSGSKVQKDQKGQSEVSPSRNGQMVTFPTNTPSYRQQPQPLGTGEGPDRVNTGLLCTPTSGRQQGVMPGADSEAQMLTAWAAVRANEAARPLARTTHGMAELLHHPRRTSWLMASLHALIF